MSANTTRQEMLLKTENKKAQPLTTAVWRNGGCSASYDSFVLSSSAVIRLNFCAKNPPPSPSPKPVYPTKKT
jgi:hypothetical protein